MLHARWLYQTRWRCHCKRTNLHSTVPVRAFCRSSSCFSWKHPAHCFPRHQAVWSSQEKPWNQKPQPTNNSYFLLRPSFWCCNNSFKIAGTTENYIYICSTLNPPGTYQNNVSTGIYMENAMFLGCCWSRDKKHKRPECGYTMITKTIAYLTNYMYTHNYTHIHVCSCYDNYWPWTPSTTHTSISFSHLLHIS